MTKIPKRFQKRFKRIIHELDDLMRELVEVCPDARIYVTNGEVHLMEDSDVMANEDDRMTSVRIHYMDCGDW